MVTNRVCVICGDFIDAASLSFEQRLIRDQDFCRKCWDEIMMTMTTTAPTTIADIKLRAPITKSSSGHDLYEVKLTSQRY